jgi:hypothetical protein
MCVCVCVRVIGVDRCAASSTGGSDGDAAVDETARDREFRALFRLSQSEVVIDQVWRMVWWCGGG